MLVKNRKRSHSKAKVGTLLGVRSGFNRSAMFIMALIFVAVGGHALFDIFAAGPATPPAQSEVCGNSSVLNGPSTTPGGSHNVTQLSGISGNGSSGTPYNLSNVSLATSGYTYYFPTGTYVLGSSQYSQIDAAQGDTYIGGPGAIINGQGINDFAFVASYQAPFVTNVTIEYLTIENFIPPGSQAAVNANGGPSWTIQYDTIQNNAPGSALMLGSGDDVEHNCLTLNGQYAFNGFINPAYPSASPATGGPENVNLSNNEISYNDTCNWESASPNPVPSGDIQSNCAGNGQNPYCGCSGGGKFWRSENVTVDNNYVHDNYNVGLWADTNNDGLQFEGNYIANNYNEGLMYEVSYNALISGNTFINNAYAGVTNPGFPTGAIYVSESGGDSSSNLTNSFGYTTLDITNNTFTNNWSGVVLYEDPDRFCGGNIIYGKPDSVCTLADPSVTSSPTVCATALQNSSENQPTDTPDYFDLCRWKTQNVSVSGNTFNFNPAAIGSSCTYSNGCGMNALFSYYGGNPYANTTVPTNITFNQSNLFSNNTYTGPWKFFAWSQGSSDNPVSFATWSSPVTDKCGSSGEISSGACNSGFGQDIGSTYNSSGGTPPTVADSSLPNDVYIQGGTTMTITPSVTVNNGGSISSASLYVDGTLVGTDTTSPYNFTIHPRNYTNGAHTVLITATDNQGDIGDFSDTVIINNGDLNNDGCVGGADLSTLANNWGTLGGTYAQGNMVGADSSTPINGSDLSVLANNWHWKANGVSSCI